MDNNCITTSLKDDNSIEKQEDIKDGDYLEKDVAKAVQQDLGQEAVSFETLSYIEMYGLMNLDEKLIEKIISFVEALEVFRQKSELMSIYSLLWEVMYNTGYYDYVGTMPAGKARQANLDLLLSRASSFESTSYNGLFNFLRYVQRMQKFEVDFGEASILGENENLVRVMSIHKSKGLEFPVVFVAGMDNIIVPGADGTLHTNYEGKANAAIKALTEDGYDLGAIRNNENNEYHQDNKIYAVVEIETNNVNDFISAWDSIGIYKEENDGVYEEEDCCIYAVIMNMHGTETEISNGVGRGYSLRMTLDDINDLERKPVQRLILLQCSAGNIDYAGENVASSFARNVSGKVLAGDKEVHNYKVKPDDSKVKVKIYYVENQNFYMTYYADGRGWYQYRYDWNEEVIRYEYMAPPQIDNMYRIYQLISMLDV